MFNNLIVRAKSVRAGNVFKFSSQKCTVVETARNVTDGQMIIRFTTNFDTTVQTLIVDPESPIKIYQK